MYQKKLLNCIAFLPIFFYHAFSKISFNSLLIFCLSSFVVCTAYDGNLVILIDDLQQETVTTEEVNMTHQCITALQQKASSVLISTSLWKNIFDRKKNFEAQLQDPLSLVSKILDLYQTTNQELKIARYNLALINQKLSQAWFVQNYPELAELEKHKLDQVRFDFLCYTFQFDMQQWRVYNAHTGMLLFVPRASTYEPLGNYEVINDQDFIKHADKKSQLVASLTKLCKGKKDRWVIYLSGHGHPKSFKQEANIAGLKISDFKKVLSYLHESMQVKLLVYSSCYGGGVHTIEPYANLRLNYPVIVTAATDAPIFGFGVFEGIKLPPYDDQFTLQATDVGKDCGLLPYALQNYHAFFKRAWQGQFDLHLVQHLSRFFNCDMLLCHVQKIENFPLIRKAGDIIFTPLHDSMMMKLVQQATSNTVITTNKPLLLYTKKVKKISIDHALPIISMLPGMQSHEIGELIAPHVPFSQLLTASFLSLEDVQACKNFMIKKLVCCNDVIGEKANTVFTNVLILDQENLRPKFYDKDAQALIYCQLHDQHYLLAWNAQHITDQMVLQQEHIDIMSQIRNLVQQAVDYHAYELPEELLTFDAYVENKAYQQNIVDTCVKRKVCKK